MTRTASRAGRPAFTLVELLVAMGTIIALAAIALLVVPDALNRDRTTDGAGTVRQTLTIAKARALRDNVPCGVRFITGSDPGNLAKTNGLWVTELQYVQQPQPIGAGPGEEIEIAFRTELTGPNPPVGTILIQPQPSPPNPKPQSPEIFYKGPMSSPLLQFILANATAAKPVEVRFFRGDDLVTVQVAGLVAETGARAGQFRFAFAAGQTFDALINTLGGGTSVSVTSFYVEPPPQPLLGEPPVQLPRNVCVDLAGRSPSLPAGSIDFDILFAPNGQVLMSDGQINLWVRDYTKPGGDPNFYDGSTTAQSPAADFTKGGEQQVVALKAKSGSMGVFPINQDATNPFKFAKEAASQP